MNRFLVSVIIWTYNHEKYIGQAIKSIVDQERDFELEIIIGDDFSTDGAREVMKDYASRYSFIKLLFPNRNNGPNENVIQTLKNCKGKYVAFLDGDDYWCDSRKLMKQVNFMENNPEVNLCFNNVQIIGKGDGENLAYPPNRKKFIDCYDLMGGDFTHTNATIVRNSIGLFNPVINRELPGADTILFLLPLIDNGVGYFFSETMSTYRVHSGGIYSMRSTETRFRLDMDETMSMINFFKEERFKPFLQKKYSDLLYYYAVASAKDLQIFKATFYHVKYLASVLRTLHLKKLISPYAVFAKALVNRNYRLGINKKP